MFFLNCRKNSLGCRGIDKESKFEPQTNETARQQDDNMSATSSCEVTMTPFTKRIGINVRVYLLDIHRRRFRTTVEGMESKIEEKIFYHA
jgi:hypothetical protein